MTSSVLTKQNLIPETAFEIVNRCKISGKKVFGRQKK